MQLDALVEVWSPDGHGNWSWTIVLPTFQNARLVGRNLPTRNDAIAQASAALGRYTDPRAAALEVRRR